MAFVCCLGIRLHQLSILNELELVDIVHVHYAKNAGRRLVCTIYSKHK
jgi:hypothetical protein